MGEVVDRRRPRQAGESERLARESAAAFEAAEATADPGARADQLEAAQDLAGDSALAAAYTYLQQIVGVIAVLLPLTVAVGDLALGGDALQGSISAYYYTSTGNVFVGALCALAVFFLSYNYRALRGFQLDRTLSNIASLAAVGVALFPTTDDAATASDGEKVVAFVHLLFAGSLFVLLGVFSFFLFTKTGGSAEAMTEAKRRRNVVFRTCGAIIFGAILLVAVANLADPPDSWHALFWLETVAVMAFGVSWLVKGGFKGILADPAPAPGDG
jgi:hypothetical protein